MSLLLGYLSAADYIFQPHRLPEVIWKIHYQSNEDKTFGILLVMDQPAWSLSVLSFNILDFAVNAE